MARKRRPFSIRHEGGQSLVIIAIAMGLFMGMAAMAIDASQWYQRHHQAQVVADSAALAAANCLANPNGGSTVVNGASLPDCSSSTDTSDAQSVAVAYASANGLAISDSDVVLDTTNGTVTVTANVSGATIFAKFVGLLTSSQTARATASWKPSVQKPCSSSGSTNCDFMFAYNDGVCSTGTALTVAVTGSASIVGNIVTNGNLNGSQTGGGNTGDISGNESYGSGCKSTPSGGKPWQNSPSEATAPVNWPIPYAEDFPACGGGGTELACTSSGANAGYPAWCTQTQSGTSAWSPTVTTGNIYCDSGSGSPANPSTWTSGNITTSGGSGDTFVASSITFSGGNTSSCGYNTNGYQSTTCSAPAPATFNYPIFYAVGTDSDSPDSYAFYWSSSGNTRLSGDVFVPNGTAYLSLGGTPVLTTFIEANTINASLTGNPSGDGPELDGGSGGSIVAGTDSLTG